MPTPFQNVNPQAAKRMVAEMSNRETLKWIGVAAAIHLVLIVVTSFGWMRDHWFDPAGAAARAKAAEVAEAAPPAPTAATPDKAPAKPEATATTTTPPDKPKPDDTAALI